MCEVEIGLEEQDCHRFEPKVHEHAVWDELAVVILISRRLVAAKVDDRSEHVDGFLGSRLYLLLLSCCLVVVALGAVELGLELRPDEEGRGHAGQVLEVSLGGQWVDPGEVGQVAEWVHLRYAIKVRVINDHEAIFILLLLNFSWLSLLLLAILTVLGLFIFATELF